MSQLVIWFQFSLQMRFTIIWFHFQLQLWSNFIMDGKQAININNNLYWVDDTSSFIFKGWFFKICNIPNIEFLVFSSCGNVFTWWVDGNSINLWFMSFELEFQCHVSCPNFEPSVPTDCYDEWLNILKCWWISDLTDPICVEVFLLLIFQFSNNVEKN